MITAYEMIPGIKVHLQNEEMESSWILNSTDMYC